MWTDIVSKPETLGKFRVKKLQIVLKKIFLSCCKFSKKTRRPANTGFFCTSEYWWRCLLKRWKRVFWKNASSIVLTFWSLKASCDFIKLLYWWERNVLEYSFQNEFATEKGFEKNRLYDLVGFCQTSSHCFHCSASLL